MISNLSSPQTSPTTPSAKSTTGSNPVLTPLPEKVSGQPVPMVVKAIRPLEVDSEILRNTDYLPTKRMMDVTLGILLFIVLAPVMVLVGLAVRLTSRGPAIYTQTRLGRFGQAFRIYKFRTMYHNCEKKSGVCWSVKGDSRVTWLGKILRKTHLDELPQLINVLQGDMSLVGPRPERPEFIPMLEAAIPDYRKRLLVRPGVTGLAQAYLPPDSDIESVRQKIVFDLQYIRTMNTWLDVRLMVATAFQAAGVPCPLVRLLLWLPKPSDISDQQ